MNRSIGYGQKPMEIETHSFNSMAMKCRTEQDRTDNMQRLVWPVHRTFARQQGYTENPTGVKGGVSYPYVISDKLAFFLEGWSASTGMGKFCII